MPPIHPLHECSRETRTPPATPTQSSRLKKTLTNAGLYPTPEVSGVKGARIKTQPTGRLQTFATGEPGAGLNKGGGDPM